MRCAGWRIERAKPVNGCKDMRKQLASSSGASRTWQERGRRQQMRKDVRDFSGPMG